MIGTLKEDYILSAKAKGLRPLHPLRHALRPSSLTAITVFALQLGGLIGGTVIIERLFSLCQDSELDLLAAFINAT